MGVRRERPPVERSNATIRLRLPDGTVKAMPTDELRTPATADVCCFCGRGAEETDGTMVRLTARWIDDGQDRTQEWGAHRACLAERIHDSVAGTGPFFD
jgi:hypothetical protein